MRYALAVVFVLIGFAIAVRVIRAQLHEARADADAMRSVIALGGYARRPA